jgi:hypothetical protein
MERFKIKNEIDEWEIIFCNEIDVNQMTHVRTHYFLTPRKLNIMIWHMKLSNNLNLIIRKFMGGLYIIMTNDFYLVILIQDSWIFKLKIDGFDLFSYNF